MMLEDIKRSRFEEHTSSRASAATVIVLVIACVAVIAAAFSTQL